MQTFNLLFAAVLCLAGCGAPGAPLPPSLNLPMAVRDLHAVRKGDTVTLSWTAPKNTTDGALVRKPGKMIVWRTASPGETTSTTDGASAVADVPLPPALKHPSTPKQKNKDRQRVTQADSLRELLRSGAAADFAIYTVEAVNHAGKSAGLSNRVAVPLARVPPPPKEVRVEDVPRGIRLSWEQPPPPDKTSRLSVQYSYRVMRRQEGSKQPPVTIAQVAAGSEAAAYIDKKIEWGNTYSYWVVPVVQWKAAPGKATQGTTGEDPRGEIEGDDSPPVSIAATGKFPPAIPSGLQAVFSHGASPPFIDLTWSADGDEDLAGYNVYRWKEHEPPARINADLARTPAFRDTAVRPGTRYFYAVSAVDLRGNESAQSAEASETAPPAAP